MKLMFFNRAAAVLAPLFLSSVAGAALVVTGDLQTEQGDPSDWTPETSSIVLVETPPASGIFSYALSGLTSGTEYNFKVIEGTPPVSFADPQVTPNNAWILGAGDGSGTITVNTNVLIGDGNVPHYQVGIEGGAWTPQIVGSFMDEAGGAGDWNPQDPTFDMNDLGGGAWNYSGSISTAGTYEIKVSHGAVGWSRQFGSDGFSNNAGTFQFTTTEDDQAFSVDFVPATGAFAVTVAPEPSAIACLALAGVALIRRRRD